MSASSRSQRGATNAGIPVRGGSAETGRARALFRAEFPDHGAAIRHAEAVAAAHPDATTITISCDQRVVAHVPLRPHRSSEDVARVVHESRARSRKLLRDTDGAGSAVAAATAGSANQEDSCR